VELDPAYASAEANLGHALLETNRGDEAIEHLKKALELGPETAEVHDNLGVGLAQKGRIAEAVPHFERALQIAPNLAEAHYYLGMTLVMRGQGAEGLKHWRQALKKDPDNAQTLNDTAWLLATSSDDALRNGNEAVTLAQHAVQLTRGRAPEILGTLAAAYAETGAFDKALETEQQAIELATRQGNGRLAEDLGRRRSLFEAKTAIRQR
jgi:tetratricopeptide (TPR) repeat protein